LNPHLGPDLHDTTTNKLSKYGSNMLHQLGDNWASDVWSNEAKEQTNKWRKYLEILNL